ncbi:OsmC family protein [Shewanella submarina]|uniref:OsmC family protein n=1 Tax=Shewanella submarina TaxID=2016376 RepID=A0ABV7G691_9GAMM|nr:OsmC family protein [Shewanella submarina]MCL1039356.1 OsmC family protein [Shewanella submarina]
MSKHTLDVRWQQQASDNFATGEFSREHEWLLDNGDTLKASSSPSIIAEPLSSTQAIDPEEAFIGALSSCHMMAFLAIAAKRKYIVTHYSDSPVGTLGKMANGKTGVSQLTLSPKVSFSEEKQPSHEQLQKLHQMAHNNCYIANSVTTKVDIKPRS